MERERYPKPEGDTTPDGAVSQEEVWPEARALLARDPVFRPIVEVAGPVRMPGHRPSDFAYLVRSIVYQQLAGKAAATIHGRVVDALGSTVTPEAVMAADDETLRGAGLSRGKLAAVRDLATRVREGSLSLDDLATLEDEAVLARLTVVRGIGPWTARMLLLFHLRRPDVWPAGDLGVRNGWARLHGKATAPLPREMAPLGDRYRPWRSAVAWYCWRAMDR